MKKLFFAAMLLIPSFVFAQNHGGVNLRYVDDEDRLTHYRLFYDPIMICKTETYTLYPTSVSMKIPQIKTVDSSEVFNANAGMGCIFRYEEGQKVGFWSMQRRSGCLMSTKLAKRRNQVRKMLMLLQQKNITLQKGRKHLVINSYYLHNGGKVLYKSIFFVNILPKNKEKFVGVFLKEKEE